MNLFSKCLSIIVLVLYLSNGFATEIIGVDALMQAPHKYKGKIQVEGAVARIISDKKIIVLLDRKEWEECGEEAESCSKYKLPVQFSGNLPSVKEEVVFEGEIKKSEGRFVFVASVIVKKHPPRKEDKTKD